MEDNSDLKLIEGGTILKFNILSSVISKGSSGSRKFKSEMKAMLQSKLLEGVPKVLGKYMANKDKYVKNMKFDPSSQGLSMCVCKVNHNHFFPRLHHRNPLTSDPDLF